MRLIDRIRRWLATRPGRLVLAGALGTATLMVGSIAFAQQHDPHAPAAPASAPALAGPGAGHNAPPGEQPGGGEHVKADHGGGSPDPALFNYDDIARYSKEKERKADGEHITPVTPYAYLLVNA